MRVKIGCRDIRKIPAAVECLLDLHFYDFTFVREVPLDGSTNAAGTKWTRNTDRTEEDSPSPKKPKWGEGSQPTETSNTHAGISGAGPVNKEKGKEVVKEH